ncbi:tetratricopeptide repeat protein [Polyangium jinanense]|uniref:Tetratricopeptide repeat protein n=1 Tax=Polyangium jinanense TaxID=2829994 RepID=A0A9X3WXS0_9BACT|nr:tetratricopeptide repeat protein [Polyangium jinanense]MDC3952486.1 tetratricopeptide repeat protein [Polyangium jinanense]MDC3980114.1 tetratricopeptide repeat protein [Polyangium jinanense]
MIPSVFLASIVLASPTPPSSGQGASLVAAAAASGRPQECASTVRRGLSRRPTVWELARAPELGRYCDLVARAKALLGSDPAAAKSAAENAEKVLPGYAAPRVLLARSALALGKIDDAAREFEAARGKDPRSVEDPPTMHDLAEVLRRTGKLEDALAVYRALVPRIDLLGSPDRRVAVLLEAAHVSMAVAASRAASGAAPAEAPVAEPKRAPLDEAAAYLREARQRPPSALSGDVLLSLVLVLDRNGDRVQADAALADARASGVRLRAGGPSYLAATEDKSCLEALAAEGAAAVKLWETYLAGPGGKTPWAASARARLEAAKKAPRPAGAKGGP